MDRPLFRWPMLRQSLSISTLVPASIGGDRQDELGSHTSGPGTGWYRMRVWNRLHGALFPTVGSPAMTPVGELAKSFRTWEQQVRPSIGDDIYPKREEIGLQCCSRLLLGATRDYCIAVLGSRAAGWMAA